MPWKSNTLFFVSEIRLPESIEHIFMKTFLGLSSQFKIIGITLHYYRYTASQWTVNTTQSMVYCSIIMDKPFHNYRYTVFINIGILLHIWRHTAIEHFRSISNAQADSGQTELWIPNSSFWLHQQILWRWRFQSELKDVCFDYWRMFIFRWE